MKKPYARPLTTEELLAMPDDEIDYSDIPETTAEWWANAEIVFPKGKRQVTMRFDTDVLDWFRQQGRGYQSRMNAVLRAYVEAHRGKPGPGGAQ